MRYDSNWAESAELSQLILCIALMCSALAAPAPTANLDCELKILHGVRTNHYRFPNECNVI